MFLDSATDQGESARLDLVTLDLWPSESVGYPVVHLNVTVGMGDGGPTKGSAVRPEANLPWLGSTWFVEYVDLWETGNASEHYDHQDVLLQASTWVLNMTRSLDTVRLPVATTCHVWSFPPLLSDSHGFKWSRQNLGWKFASIVRISHVWFSRPMSVFFPDLPIPTSDNNPQLDQYQLLSWLAKTISTKYESVSAIISQYQPTSTSMNQYHSVAVLNQHFRSTFQLGPPLRLPTEP